MFEVIIETELGTPVNVFQCNSRAQAIDIAKHGAKHEQGRTVVSEDGVILYEFKYEDGEVFGYDDQGNRVFNA